MQFTVLDTESSYRKLLTAPDAAARAAIFAEELIAPFAGLTQIMGGGDSSGIFREWGMWAEQFTS